MKALLLEHPPAHLRKLRQGVLLVKQLVHRNHLLVHVLDVVLDHPQKLVVDRSIAPPLILGAVHEAPANVRCHEQLLQVYHDVLEGLRLGPEGLQSLVQLHHLPVLLRSSHRLHHKVLPRPLLRQLLGLCLRLLDLLEGSIPHHAPAIGEHLHRDLVPVPLGVLQRRPPDPIDGVDLNAREGQQHVEDRDAAIGCGQVQRCPGVVVGLGRVDAIDDQHLQRLGVGVGCGLAHPHPRVAD
mmetsp:Transcript_34926/g.88197  ORF Transcript_34926/g.88197 Transcript_34926/m.88197 type:complete len:239 (-) Transcript_34926:340-1056(-)